jgi:glycosyltransferase involved in cell wall biosynthesis
MKKLSLAVFNTQPPHLYFGGVERRIIEMAKSLHNTVDTTVYSGTKAGFKKPTTINSTHINPCFSTDVAFPLDNWFFNNTLANATNKIKADIYEAHAVSGYAFLNALKKRGIKKPFIQTIHGVLADEYAQAHQRGTPTIRAKLTNLIMQQQAKQEQQAAQNATLTVTISKYSTQKIIQHYNIDKTKIRIVPNGVDTQKFKPSAECEKIKQQIGINNNLTILFVGRLIPRKGLTYLTQAAPHITKNYKQTTFLIAGNGPQKNHITTQLQKTNQTNHFKFLGDINEHTLPTLYNCADIFVLPSIQEGQGIALLEAQATAKPVVAFNVGGIPEAVKNGETGILTKPNSQELANAILKLLGNYSLRKTMGKNGRKFVQENFSWHVCAQKMLKVYQEAITTTT